MKEKTVLGLVTCSASTENKKEEVDLCEQESYLSMAFRYDIDIDGNFLVRSCNEISMYFKLRMDSSYVLIVVWICYCLIGYLYTYL